MNHKEIIVAISYKTGYKMEIVEKVIAAYIDISIKEFKQKNSIHLRGFGTLRYVYAIMRKGYNPIKRRREIFKGKNRIKFIPSKVLDKTLNVPDKE